ncbi:uncharacterized protein LOC102482483 [Tupaia chinensis]|uniref:uncharacterized protein LOC102482483 n=1 Tax=Tupaia chinensis TaxID=246437 RepID=UPI0003C8E5D5|nr:uncharacterized protein LOC102482483 [Tupaia chinensis]
MELEQHLVGVEQCKVDSDSLKHWMDSGSEIFLIDSDSEQYLMDSDNGTQGIDSDSEKCPIACASIKILQKEKHQMASDSVKRLMESEKILIETEKLWMVSASETYVRDSNTEKGGMDSASASGAYQTGKEKHPHKTEGKRHVKDSNSEPFGMYSDSEKYELASAAVKHLMDTKTFQMSTDTEGLWVDSWSERLATNLDSKSLEMASDSVKHTMKSESCQRASDLDTVWLDLSSKSKKCWMDSEGEQLDFDYSKCWDNARIYQNRSARLQYTSESQDNFQKHWDNFDRHQVDSNSRKHQINSENERHINEFESKRHLMELEREQCLIQFENERLQMNEKGERHFTESDSIKEHRIRFDNERHHFDSKSEAQRLGARKKDNRPQGFWRLVFFPLPLTQGKGTEEQHSVQQMGNSSISKIQLVRYLSDDKTVRVKEVSPTLSDKQDSQPKLKEKHNHNISLDPDRLMINKHHRKPSHKVTVFKSHCKDYTYLQSFQSSESQMNPIHLLSGEDYTSDISASVCHPNSLLPRFVAYPKTHRNNTHSLDTGAQICPKCLMEISDSLFHKCLTNSDHDSDPDCPLHVQIPLDSKYSLSSKYVRYHKTSRNSPLSQSLDPKHPVGVHCPLHWEDSKYSLCSIYLYCESCSALQNLIGLSSTCTFPMNAPNTMDHHSISGPDSVINISNAVDLESENKFNITAKPKNEANHDSKIKLISADNLKDKANAEDKPFPRDEPDQEDEPDAKEETDAEDETNSEDEDNTKGKKDPKDKSDPDDTDPKDSNAENNADTNNGSDPNGNAGPTSGTDSNSDGDTNNGTDPSSEPDPNVDNSTNNYSNSKYSTDPEDTTHTNNSDNAFVLGNNVDQDNITYSSDDTNPNYISGLQNGTDLDCTSGSNGTGPNNTIEPNNEICYNIVPGSQNIKLAPNRFDPNIIPSSSDKDSFPKREHDFNVRQINATKHNNAISPNNDAGPNYVTRSISTADHDYAVVLNYDSDLVYIPGFTHTLGSSFVVNLNYDGRLNTTASTVNTTDTSDTSSSRGAFNLNYTAGMDYGSNTNHIPRFTHFIGSINTQNVNNSTNTSNINSILPEPELEISSSSSMPNIIFGNTPTFSAGTNNTSTPDNVTTSKAFNDYRFGAHFKDFAGSMNSVSFKYATKSKDALDAKESGFLKAFSRVQSPTGIKNPDILNFHFNPNISLPKLGIIGEAESPDVVKFDISSGAINQLINTQNVNNSTNTSNINSILPEPELEISSSSSMPNIIFGNTPTFSAGTNNTSTPDNVTTSKAFNDYRFGAHFKDFAGSMNSVSFKYATKSKDALDAKESGFLKAFSRVQSPTGIKNPDILNFHFNPNISLPKLGIIGEAESPDVVKFDISSGAINQLLKLNHQTGSRQNLGP